MSKSKTLGMVLLLGMGLAKLPLEESISRSLNDQKLLQAAPDFSLRESLGQMGFAASLGGLRSLVASLTYLQAYTAFEDLAWGRVDSLMSLTTSLQPREALYWDDASWHMAYNAASNQMKDESLRLALRNKLFRDHVQRGIDILNKGLQYLPNDSRLLIRLGDIYRNRQPDPRKAAEAYLQAYANGAKPFYERQGAYELTKLGDYDSSVKAYEILKRYYDQGMHLPSILRDLPVLEGRLNIPLDKRIPRPGKSA
jgi:tetratricopeptide (TPR) repeat protein